MQKFEIENHEHSLLPEGKNGNSPGATNSTGIRLTKANGGIDCTTGGNAQNSLRIKAFLSTERET